MFSTVFTMTLMATTLADKNAFPIKNLDNTNTLSNISNSSNLTYHTYQAVLEQFNSSNCSVPFHNFTYTFNCSDQYNKTWCCEEEYSKLNTSFGNAECNRYEENETYVHFRCLNFSGSASKKWTPYELAGFAVAVIIGLVLIIFLSVKCLTRCHRSRYDRI